MVAVVGSVQQTLASIAEDMGATPYELIETAEEIQVTETDKLREQIRIDEIKIRALTDELAVTNDVLQDLILTTLGG